MASRALEVIQTDAMRLVNVQLLSAIEAGEWAAVLRLSEQLQEIAERGMYHTAQTKQQEISALAMRNYRSEPEAR